MHNSNFFKYLPIWDKYGSKWMIPDLSLVPFFIAFIFWHKAPPTTWAPVLNAGARGCRGDHHCCPSLQSSCRPVCLVPLVGGGVSLPVTVSPSVSTCAGILLGRGLWHVTGHQTGNARGKEKAQGASWSKGNQGILIKEGRTDSRYAITWNVSYTDYITEERAFRSIYREYKTIVKVLKYWNAFICHIILVTSCILH